MVPFIIVSMMLVIQFGLATYARQVIAGAAQDGAATAARHGSSPGEGVATANALVAQSGGHLMTNYSATASGGGDTVTVTTRADVVRLLPLFPTITVRASSSATVEQFNPAGR